MSPLTVPCRIGLSDGRLAGHEAGAGIGGHGDCLVAIGCRVAADRERASDCPVCAARELRAPPGRVEIVAAAGISTSPQNCQCRLR